MKRLLSGVIPIFWVILMVDVVGTSAATFDFIKINESERTILQNQAIQAQTGKNYINCLLNINPKGNIRMQEQVCYSSTAKIKQ